MTAYIDTEPRVTGARSEAPIREVVAAVGAPPVYSRWITIDQEMIDRFAALTNDHTWLHVDRERAAEGAFGTTIAHGFLTLSMIATMAFDVLPRVSDAKFGMNYGMNKVRFISPVRQGSRVRGAFVLSAVKGDEGSGRVEMTYSVTIEIEGVDKSALVAEWIRVALF